ncbi:MAG TPA: type II toxin-antitoxin system RelE/ParE family toxin [Dongiaceae bacterium]|jgi:phage-related protein
MSPGLKRLPAAFYRLPAGDEPVRDWLKGLDHGDRKVLGDDIRLLEFGWPQGMPLCRAMGQGLWEVRSALSGGRVARVMFCIASGKMILLHAFIKKSRKTPKADLTLARRRQKEIES